MGLLPEVARDIGVSIPEAGHVISAYALGVVVGAPALAVACASWGRRALLVALMAVYALGNFASALAPGYALLTAMRLFTACPTARTLAWPRWWLRPCHPRGAAHARWAGSCWG